MTGTEIRSPVPGPRFDCFRSGLPGSSKRCIWPSEFGSPISGNKLTIFLPPLSKTLKISPGGIVSQAGRGASDSKMPAAFISSVTGVGFFSKAPVPSLVYPSPRI